MNADERSKRWEHLGHDSPNNRADRRVLTSDHKIRGYAVTVRELETCERALVAFATPGPPTPDTILWELGVDEARHRILMGLVVTMATEDGLLGVDGQAGQKEKRRAATANRRHRADAA